MIELALKIAPSLRSVRQVLCGECGQRITQCQCLKECKLCGEMKPKSEFKRDYTHTDNRSSWCLKCLDEWQTTKRKARQIRQKDLPYYLKTNPVR